MYYYPFLVRQSIENTYKVDLQKALSLSWTDMDGHKYFSTSFVGFFELEVVFQHPASAALLYMNLRMTIMETGEWIPSISYFQPIQVELDKQPAFWVCIVSTAIFTIVTLVRIAMLALDAHKVGPQSFFADGWNWLDMVTAFS